MSQDLGEILVASGALQESDLQRARAHQRNGGVALEEALASLGLVDEPTVYRALAKADILTRASYRYPSVSSGMGKRWRYCIKLKPV